jgi:hypothetical protein
MVIITYRTWRWTSVAVVLPRTARCRLLDLVLLELIFIFKLVFPLVSSISILGGRLCSGRSSCRGCNGTRGWRYERNTVSTWYVDAQLWLWW